MQIFCINSVKPLLAFFWVLLSITLVLIQSEHWRNSKTNILKLQLPLVSQCVHPAKKCNKTPDSRSLALTYRYINVYQSIFN